MLKWVFLISVWLTLGCVLCWHALRARKVTKLGRAMVEAGLAPLEWVPFIRVDNMPSCGVLFVRSFLVGPASFILAFSTVGLSCLSSAILPTGLMVDLVALVSRGVCCAFGIRIVERGLRASVLEAPCIVANHNSAMDIFILLCKRCSFVSMDAVQHLPLVGRIAKAIGCIFVVRDSAASRAETKLAIAKRFASNVCKCQLVVFPEGSTTNGESLLQFRRGAFEACVPIQPVFIEFADFNLNFTIVSLLQLCSLACVLPAREVTLHWLPVVPVSPEITPDQMAERVRDAIAATPSAYGRPSLRKVEGVSHRNAVAASEHLLGQL